MTEPRFKRGDLVIVKRGGHGNVWRVVRDVTEAADLARRDRAYALFNGTRERYVTESALEPAPPDPPLRVEPNVDPDEIRLSTEIHAEAHYPRGEHPDDCDGPDCPLNDGAYDPWEDV